MLSIRYLNFGFRRFNYAVVFVPGRGTLDQLCSMHQMLEGESGSGEGVV